MIFSQVSPPPLLNFGRYSYCDAKYFVDLVTHMWNEHKANNMIFSPQKLFDSARFI